MAAQNQCPGGGYTIVWRIKNFKFCSIPQKGCLKSPEFQIYNLYTGVKWSLQFYPRGNHDINVECGLNKIPLISHNFKCKFCACSTEKIMHVQETDIPLNYSYITIACFRRELIESLPDDTLVLHCHLWNTLTNIPMQNPEHFFAETQMILRQFVFCEKVEQFSLLQLGGKVLKTLYHPSNSSLSTVLSLFLAGENLENARVQIIMNVKDLTQQKFASGSLYVMDESGKTRKIMQKVSWLSAVENALTFSLKRSELIGERFPNDTIILKGELTMSGNYDAGTFQQVVYGLETKDAVAAVMDKPSYSLKCPSVRLSSDLLDLLEETMDVASALKIIREAPQLKARALAFISAQGQVAFETDEWKEFEREDPKQAFEVLRQMVVLMNPIKKEEKS